MTPSELVAGLREEADTFGLTAASCWPHHKKEHDRCLRRARLLLAAADAIDRLAGGVVVPRELLGRCLGLAVGAADTPTALAIANILKEKP